jgi:hypothetical protein
LIEQDDLLKVKKQALAGDTEALRKVLDYYLFIAPNAPEAEMWIKLAKSKGLYRDS